MINIKAVQTTLNVGPQAGKDRFVMQAQNYSTLSESKVIAETAARTNMSKQLIRACWEGCAEIIKAWATEGHSIPIPGLGHMRFGIRATSVEKVEDVKANLITSRRVIFIPSVEIKEELAKTSISITCYDKDGKKIKTVTSADTDDIEEDDGSTTDNTGGGSNTNSGGSTSGGSNTGGSNNGSTSDGSTGGNNSGGSNTGGSGSNTGGSTGGNAGGNSGSQNGTEGDYRLVIYKYGNGTSTVTDDSEQEINSNDNVHSGSNVNISVVPVEGKEPIAKVNGNRITLTENDGTYTGSFQMPTKGTVLEINSEPDEWDYADQD